MAKADSTAGNGGGTIRASHEHLLQALNTMFDIRALAVGAYGILEGQPDTENAYRLMNLVITRAERAIAQLNKAEAALMTQKGGAA